MKRLILALGVGLMTTLTLLWLLDGSPQTARAASFMVCPDGPPACDYDTIQAAVDAASDGDVIKVVGGVYTGVQQRNGVTQVVYIDKSISIRGGYTLTNGTLSDPVAYPTTLDAQGQGRVIYATAPTPGGSINLNIEGLRIIGGDSIGLGGTEHGIDAGGGVYVVSATLAIKNSQILSNSSLRAGGGLYIRESDVTFNYNTVSSNDAFSVGGLLQVGGKAEFVGNTFSSNGAVFGCGGLYLDKGDATFNDNVISFNYSAEESGGLCLSRSNAKLQDNEIVDNGGIYGGGLSIHDSNVILDGNSILSNTIFSVMGHDGGGLYIRGSVVTLTDNIISFNTAGWRGDGVYFNSTDAVLVNNIIADNQARYTMGSELYVDAGTSLSLMHNTIARAVSGGSSVGVYVTGLTNTIALTNNILISHQVGITVAAGSTATLQGTLWGNAQDWDGTGVIITGTHNVWGDPDFTRGHHIGPGSAARDAGVDAGVSNDMDGDERPQGLGFDLGADELRVALEVSKQAQPAQARAGKPLTYNLRLINTGQATLHATVSDTLPMHVAPGSLLIPSGTLSSTLVFPGGVLTWTDITLTPGQVWTTQFSVTVEPGYTGPLTNIVQATSSQGATGSYTLVSPVALEWYSCYLPLLHFD
jgi:hypothetical protein